MLKKIAKRLKKAQHIAIFTHTNPDGDALGSSFAVKYALESIGKQATIYLEKEMPEKYRFLGTDVKIADCDTVPFEDTAIMLDCGEFSRLGKCADICRKVPCILCVDHHKTGDDFGDFYYNESDAAATAQIVYKLVKLLTKNVPEETYYAIFTGMSTDTGHFKFSNVTAETLRIAADVLESGINHRKVTTILYDTVKREKMMFLGAATEKVQLYFGGKVAVLDCPLEFLKEYGLTYDDVDELPNIPLNLEGVDVSVLIKDLDEDKKRVSLRTKDVIDVSEIAVEFGGGGHKAAAAFVIDGDIDEKVKKLIDSIVQKLGE